jgi:ribosomal protein L37AE/L43A
MIEYPPEPLPGESRAEWDRRVAPWRMEMKRKLLARRGWRCERCGQQGGVLDLDEALVTRGDMRGLSLEQRRLSFGEVNLAIVCADCNRTRHDREGAWARACGRYGEDVVRAWYASLRLRAPRAEWMPNS